MQIPSSKLERVEGIEPSHRPWQGCRLPLHHTRVNKLVDPSGIEPLTTECKSVVLPLAPRAHKKVAEGEGAAPSVVFRPRQFSKLLRLPNYSSTFHKKWRKQQESNLRGFLGPRRFQDAFLDQPDYFHKNWWTR